MKKKLVAFFATAGAAAVVIYLSGYHYIFKAIAKNIAPGPITPSSDDEEKFPSHLVSNAASKAWRKHPQYNFSILTETLTKELKKTRASSLLVIKDNELFFEQYWKDHHPSSLMNSFSMAKGILSLLVGCAIKDGSIVSENQLVSDLIPEYRNNPYGKHLKIRHLMTMQAGYDWKEEYNHPFAENSKQYFVEDLEEQALNVAFKEMPGQKYEYQSVAAQVLGIVLKRAVGKPLSDYLSQKLWKPLQMEYAAKWSVDNKGMEKAFCCIHATSRDFAKIGQLILQEGKWQGQQIIGKDFCAKMLTPTEENDAFGFTIWADDDSPVKCRFFYGFLGQFIIVIPGKNLIIVKTGFYNRLDVDEKKRPLQVNILVEEISALVAGREL
ncbi:CubicO group peptidase (beta-lactamase class C family) [Epilithonimonas hungarica]|uniref:serine hydrolase domain-containing protein n=1 Tax=Epilithonimonas hungarica TaxID=454006 RepID=UPI00277F9100|nr:serine hydrolase [Epilithonimonas hungarica]MDP9956054.1 CubicO group peptidase (beta-lactamase class C family) [Epilithonimonas hungarica]